MVGGDEAASTKGYRTRHRAKRRREFLDIARRILTVEGQDALTMQRLTDEVGGSVGSVYYYFPTRNALLGALQQDAFEMLLESYRQGRATLERHLAAQAPPPEVVALAGVLASCIFWVESESTMPVEIELSRRMIVAGTETELEPETGVLPTAMSLLNEGRERLDAAVEAGALDADNNVERAVMLIASMTGFLMVSRLGGWDADLFDGRRLATSFAANTLRGWGAREDHLAAAVEHLQAFLADDQIAPAVHTPPT